MPLQLHHVETQQKIFDMILDRDGRKVAGFIRAGSTEDPHRRKKEYEDQGYGGDMFYAKTENMRDAENRLLKARDFRHNAQGKSNANDGPGYIYVIKGRKNDWRT